MVLSDVRATIKIEHACIHVKKIRHCLPFPRCPIHGLYYNNLLTIGSIIHWVIPVLALFPCESSQVDILSATNFPSSLDKMGGIPLAITEVAFVGTESAVVVATAKVK